VTTLLVGFGVALAVSIPPGANTALCIAVARNGARQAVPVIAAAAATDALYAVLAAAGILALNGISHDAVRYLAAGFCLVGAVLLWKPGALLSTRTAVGLALLNPGTAALWLGLSAITRVRPHGLGLLFWVLGVVAGTTTWFSGLAIASAHIHRRVSNSGALLLRRVCAGLLVVVGLVSLVSLV
jgi:threonine/homoserine/homoserine lactone efflux protein